MQSDRSYVFRENKLNLIQSLIVNFHDSINIRLVIKTFIGPFKIQDHSPRLLNYLKVLEVDTEINCASPTYLRTSFVASYADGIVMTNRWFLQKCRRRDGEIFPVGYPEITLRGSIHSGSTLAKHIHSFETVIISIHHSLRLVS